MCGITGYISDIKKDSDYFDIKFQNILKILERRGPDSSGIWSDNKDLNVYLGHTRLSILDTSSFGSQPMSSKNKRYVIVYNGECYNHNYLRNKCDQYLIDNKREPILWSGNSDTETILEFFCIFGIETTLSEIDGMFSFSIWDIKSNDLICARDKFGEKPFFYFYNTETFIFSSDISVFSLFEDLKVNYKSLQYYLSHGYFGNNQTIYNEVSSLQPGSYLKISQKEKKLDIKKYFDVFKKINIKKNKRQDKNLDDLDNILNNAVKSQMISDVPIGSFLSGGIDSSLITAIMQNHSEKKINTYSIGFENSDYDESSYAKIVADQIGTKHHNIIFTAKDALKLIPDLPKAYSMPFADPSQLPTLFLSKFAAKDIKVALSGDGGDELFGGYNRYEYGKRFWPYIKILPKFIKRVIPEQSFKDANGLTSLSMQAIIKLWNKNKNIPQVENKLWKFMRMAKSNSLEELYLSLSSQWDSRVIIKNNSIIKNMENPINNLSNISIEEKLMLSDIVSYLPNDILVKVDRASMYNSLEVRAPYLNSKVYEFSNDLDINQKINGTNKKFILKNLLNKYVTNFPINRHKQGFSMPLAEWLRNELREWAESLLTKKNVEKINYLKWDEISKIWKNFLNNQVQSENQIWIILMLLAWNEEYKKF